MGNNVNIETSEKRKLEDISILIIDDQADIRQGLKRLISSLGCEIDTANSAESALDILGEDNFDIVFLDIKMGGMSGIDLLNEIMKRWVYTKVVMITGHGTIEMAVQCLHTGASHFITKPWNNEEILEYVERTGFQIQNKKVARTSISKYSTHLIVARDDKMQSVMKLVEQVSPTKVPVLIEGASGTGKELIAHSIHQKSKISGKKFLAINCASLPDSLLESELFGYTKGAFTGAHKDTTGLFEQAEGGTIFLDEIASMSLAFQSKLLRVLQDKCIRRLGGSKIVNVDFRLITATNKNLGEMVKKGEFREDLIYRINIMKISLPSLNERRECIPLLAEYFIQKFTTELFGENESYSELNPAAIEALKQHNWQGNVRELENSIQRALVVCQGEKISPSHLGITSNDISLDKLFNTNVTYEEGKQKAIEDFQRNFISSALKRTNGNITHAAKLCGLTRAAFQRIMRKMEM